MPESPKNKQILTIPNLLSMFRILLIPLIVWLYCGRQDYPLAAWVLLLSGATDIADGFIARRFHMVSDLGKVLDPDGGPDLPADPVPGDLVAPGRAGDEGDRHGRHGPAGHPPDGRGLQRRVAWEAGHLRPLRRHPRPYRLVRHSPARFSGPGPGGRRQHPAEPSHC